MDNQFSLTKADELGEPLGEFNSRSDIMRFLLPATFLLIGLLILALIFVYLPTIPGLFAVLGLGIGLMFAGMSGYVMVQNFLEGNWRVQTYAAGMQVTRKGKNEVLRWSEIKSVTQRDIMSYSFGEEDGILLGTYRIYTIHMQNGKKYTFSGIKVERLGQLIYRQTTKTPWKV